jgi:RNA polymerase sigma-70 factor (ECF subfamily)
MERLRPEHREALILVAASGLSYDDAAALCACAVGTMKSRVNRARARLTELLAVPKPRRSTKDVRLHAPKAANDHASPSRMAAGGGYRTLERAISC